MKWKLCALLIICMLALAAPSSPVRAGAVDEKEEVSFKLKGLDGRVFELEKLRGNVLLVSFGATWCQPCVAELRALEELKQEYAGRPVRILWVTIEGEDEISDRDLREYARRQRVTLPVLRDVGKLTYAQFSSRLRVPLVVFFDAEGRVARPVQFGMAKPEEYKTRVRERIDELLAGQKLDQKSSAATKRFGE